MKRVVVLCVVLSVLFFGVFFAFNKENEKQDKDVALNTVEKIQTTQNNEESYNKKQIYGVWLTYSEISSLVKDKDEKEYKESLEKLFSNLKENKINTVFYQCRAFCDSFYNSSIFPVSKYISSTNVDLPYDPFEIFLEIGKAWNVEVHCWVNPYRVSYDNKFEKLPKHSPARKLYKENKNALLICDKGIYLNPSVDEVRELVLNGIREILNKYQVAGIHFDDYFYPETKEINDSALFEKYRNDGGALGLADWRRENVSALIASVYSLVKGHDENLVFSISPSADIKKCKNVFYADVEKWCEQEGVVDYIIPQIYFGFKNEKMPFSSVVKEWEKLVEKSEVELICGLAAYKCGRDDKNAGTGKDEWNENVNILSRQYEQIAESQAWQGFSLFSYSYCFGENINENSKKEIKNLLYMVE